MRILSFNPGHDGALAYLKEGRLITSIEAEKDSRYRHSPVSIQDMFNIFGDLEEIPDVICRGGWWPGDTGLSEQQSVSGYHGVDDIIVGKEWLFGKKVNFFSSSHERSHILCAFGMSNLPKSTPCYALLWEGVIGAFYKIDEELNITKLADVMPEPGHRYALLYGIGDPTFDKEVAEFSRFSDAGKLMALASFSKRSVPSDEEEKIISFLMQDCHHLKPQECENLRSYRHYNVGLDDAEFRNFAGIVSDRIFDRFYQFARYNREIDFKEIQNVLYSCRKTELIETLKLLKYRVRIPTDHPSLKELEKLECPLISYKPDESRYFKTTEERFAQGILDSDSIDFIKEKKIRIEDIAGYTNGNHSVLADLDVFKAFSKEHVQQKASSILHNALIGRIQSINMFGSLFHFPGNIPKFVNEYDVEVNFKDLLKSLMIFLEVSLLNIDIKQIDKR